MHPTESEPNADDLVTRARTDRLAFGKLYDLMYPPVFRYCLRSSGNRSRAEDITSSVFLHVAGSMVNFSGATFEEFRRWVFTIATNEINADCRKTTRRQALLTEARDSGQLRRDSAGENIHDRLEPDALQAALLKLSDRAQSLVNLRFFSGLSYDDIGVILSISTGAARTATFRAIEELRSELGNHYES